VVRCGRATGGRSAARGRKMRLVGRVCSGGERAWWVESQVVEGVGAGSVGSCVIAQCQHTMSMHKSTKPPTTSPSPFPAPQPRRERASATHLIASALWIEALPPAKVRLSSADSAESAPRSDRTVAPSDWTGGVNSNPLNSKRRRLVRPTTAASTPFGLWGLRLARGWFRRLGLSDGAVI